MDFERDETPGVFEGERYDVVQRDISTNHLSHVPHGRAGEEVTIHLDSADDIGIQLDEETMSKLGKKTTTQDEDPTALSEEQLSKGILKVLGSLFSKFMGGSENAEPAADDNSFGNKISGFKETWRLSFHQIFCNKKFNFEDSRK